MIRLVCPQCGTVNRHAVQSSGTVQRCDGCGFRYRVPYVIEARVEPEQHTNASKSSIGWSGLVLFVSGILFAGSLLFLCIAMATLSSVDSQKYKQNPSQQTNKR